MDLDLRGQTVYDVGAYKGYHSIVFARAGGRKGKVIAFEPHPKNYKKMLRKIKLNMLDNIEVRQIAIAREMGNGTLASRPSQFGTSSLQEDIQTKILKEEGGEAIPVKMDSLDHQISANHLPKPNLVKIDVEGLEKDVLLGMNETIKDRKPKLFIEIHGVDVKSKTENAQKVTEFLLARKYSIYHIESGTEITSGNCHVAKEGHLYCT